MSTGFPFLTPLEIHLVLPAAHKASPAPTSFVCKHTLVTHSHQLFGSSTPPPFPGSNRPANELQGAVPAAFCLQSFSKTSSSSLQQGHWFTDKRLTRAVQQGETVTPTNKETHVTRAVPPPGRTSTNIPLGQITLKFTRVPVLNNRSNQRLPRETSKAGDPVRLSGRPST